jgi:hypothetical protein
MNKLLLLAPAAAAASLVSVTASAADMFDGAVNADLAAGQADITEAGTVMIGLAITVAVVGWIMAVIV